MTETGSEISAGQTSAPPKGAVSEIYSSFQGEGLFVGERHIFVRLAGCPWRCRYCDTPGSLAREGHKELSVEDVLDEIHHEQEKREARTVSLTGGEPLAQAPFARALMSAVRRFGWKAYLETSGTQPDLLRRVIDECDVVAMDVKMPSAIGRAFWAEHAEFLAVAGVKAFVKAVVTGETTDAEWRETVQLVAAASPQPPLVIQPVTAVEDLEHRLKPNGVAPVRIAPPEPHRLLQLWQTARQAIDDVRLVPQMHPLWKVP